MSGYAVAWCRKCGRRLWLRKVGEGRVGTDETMALAWCARRGCAPTTGPNRGASFACTEGGYHRPKPGTENPRCLTCGGATLWQEDNVSTCTRCGDEWPDLTVETAIPRGAVIL